MHAPSQDLTITATEVRLYLGKKHRLLQEIETDTRDGLVWSHNGRTFVAKWKRGYILTLDDNDLDRPITLTIRGWPRRSTNGREQVYSVLIRIASTDSVPLSAGLDRLTGLAYACCRPEAAERAAECRTQRHITAIAAARLERETLDHLIAGT